jgi:GT2 family glycosyltransferase
MVRAEAYSSVGGFDEDYFMYAEEMDLCYRLSRWARSGLHQKPCVLLFDAGSHGGPADENRIARIAAGQRLFFRKHYPPARAQLYEGAWLGASCIKYMLWRVAAMLTGNQGYRAKARWHRIFVQRYRALEYPLHPTV